MSKLKDLRNTPDDKIRDDDHLDRPDISEKDAEKIVQEIIETHDLKPAEKKRPSKFAKATVDALNKLKTILIVFLITR